MNGGLKIPERFGQDPKGFYNWLFKRIFHLDPSAESELAYREEGLRLLL